MTVPHLRRGGESRRGRLEKRSCRAVVAQQRFDFRSELRILTAGIHQERVAFLRRVGRCRMIQLRNAIVSIGDMRSGTAHPVGWVAARQVNTFATSPARVSAPEVQPDAQHDAARIDEHGVEAEVWVRAIVPAWHDKIAGTCVVTVPRNWPLT